MSTEQLTIPAALVVAGVEHERKAFDVTEIKMRQEDPAGTFEAVVSVFGNVDGGGDVVMPGAFDKTIADWTAKGRLPAVVWSHDWDTVIGKTIAMKETREGLFVKARLYVEPEAHNDDAKRVHHLLKDGAVGEFSFGYEPMEVEYEERDGRPVRLLKSVGLHEISPTLVGMNPATRLVGIKAAEASTESGGGPGQATPPPSVPLNVVRLLEARPEDRRSW